jgi:hypothetical protein
VSSPLRYASGYRKKAIGTTVSAACLASAYTDRASPPIFGNGRQAFGNSRLINAMKKNTVTVAANNTLYSRVSATAVIGT